MKTLIILFLSCITISAQFIGPGAVVVGGSPGKVTKPVIGFVGAAGQDISDDFNRADNSDIGANWTVVTSEQPFRIVSQVVDCTLGSESNDHCERYSGVSWTANQSSECKVVCSATEGPGSGFGVVVRASDSTRSYYRLVINGDGEWEMGVNNSGTFTALSSGTTTFSSGAIIKLSATGTGTSTVLVSTYNGSQINSFQHNMGGGSPINSGWPGISYSSATVSGTIDDWRGIDGL